jgi:3-hydroxybutyryl-CoA dehydrogenase
MTTIKKIGIIGAGQMGSGIAQVCAQAGYDVVLSDISDAVLEKALASIGRNYDRQIQKGKMEEQAKTAALGRIVTGTDLSVFGESDLVIEAATENEALKRDLLKKLVPHLKPEALIATNTSSISITRLAAATDRPAKFMGMHFMNPVPVMQLVELIRGIATDEPTFNAIKELTLAIGKTAAVAEDFPAFIVNRILLPMINEAVYTLYEGVGSVDAIDTAMKLGKTIAVAEDFPAFIVNRILLPMINEAVYTLYEGVGGVEAIDTALKLGANHPMGPLELADFFGLDTCLAVMQVLYEGLADSKYRPCPLLVEYVEAGWIGKKYGRGFYDYSQTPPVPTR